jgi:hypothetical protein
MEPHVCEIDTPFCCWREIEESEEVYNSTETREGEYLEYYGEPGIFYQTYGNGGGKGGWGGYWVRDGGRAVWAVAGNSVHFSYLNNHVHQYSSPKSNGTPARIRVFIPSPEELEEELEKELGLK